MQRNDIELFNRVNPLFSPHAKIQNKGMHDALDGLQQESKMSKKYNDCNLCTKCNGSPSAQASLLNRTASSKRSKLQCMLIQMQKNYGNRYVQRVLEIAKKGDDAGISSEVESAIQGKRGGGQALDKEVQAQMEPIFETKFSNVRVHNDSGADALNQQLNARAFTTGNDIFFKAGEYNPGSSQGCELLAHELTHVVQQTDGIQHKLTVGKPGDIYEMEADKVAKEVMQQEQKGGDTKSGGEKVRRQEEEEEELMPLLQKQAEEEEEEELQTKTNDKLQQQPVEEEEEELQAKTNDNWSTV